ncbi:hypothetical protein B0H13DRAFT_2271621 [Mycena leptocephala]|nr:hypothetical protein B0H13DRAFT_2271621 [Mycena leptocephala]
MPDITILPANLATLVLESFLYGLLLLLFISTVYFFATRRTLAGASQTARHHFTSLVFLGLAALFLVATVHWSIVIYQAFFAFIHLGTISAEDAFYADLAQPSEVAKEILFFVAVLLGDALVRLSRSMFPETYRLWIIWGRNRYVVVFPILALIGLAGLIIFRISRITKTNSTESHLTWSLSILAESAALQTLWLTLTAVTLFADSDVEFIGVDCFPAILGISNTLIHARVGLGWSSSSVAGHYKPQSATKYPGDAVYTHVLEEPESDTRKKWLICDFQQLVAFWIEFDGHAADRRNHLDIQLLFMRTTFIGSIKHGAEESLQSHCPKLKEQRSWRGSPAKTPVPSPSSKPSGDPNATTCTNAINEQYAACLDCQAQEGHEAESDEQPDYNAYFSFCVDAGFRIKNVTIDGAWAAFNQSSGSKTNSAAGQVGVGGFGMVAWFVGIVGVGLLDLVSTL